MCTGRLFYRPLNIAAVAGTFMHLYALYEEKLLFLSKLHKKYPVYCSFRSYDLHIYIFTIYSNGIPTNLNYTASTVKVPSV